MMEFLRSGPGAAVLFFMGLPTLYVLLWAFVMWVNKELDL